MRTTVAVVPVGVNVIQEFPNEGQTPLTFVLETVESLSVVNVNGGFET